MQTPMVVSRGCPYSTKPMLEFNAVCARCNPVVVELWRDGLRVTQAPGGSGGSAAGPNGQGPNSRLTWQSGRRASREDGEGREVRQFGSSSSSTLDPPMKVSTAHIIRRKVEFRLSEPPQRRPYTSQGPAHIRGRSRRPRPMPKHGADAGQRTSVPSHRSLVHLAASN